MKKFGIINARLIGELTDLKHMDTLVICDAGFPVPQNGNIIDLSLVNGIPTAIQVLEAVTKEIGFEEFAVFDDLETVNKEYFDIFEKLLPLQRRILYSPQEFVAESKNAKLFIRTGDFAPYSNILLTSAC